ncbi:MAG: hypothetical protein VXB67_14195, partial [Deltaproteobacteria bacterium]
MTVLRFSFQNGLLPTLVLGERGPLQWWVKVYFTWKSEEIGKFGVAPHPAYSATFSPKEKQRI